MRGDEGFEDAVDQRVHDGGESRADYHAYCKPHDVAAGDEFLEFGEDLGHFDLFHSDILLGCISRFPYRHLAHIACV